MGLWEWCDKIYWRELCDHREGYEQPEQHGEEKEHASESKDPEEAWGTVYLCIQNDQERGGGDCGEV